MNRSSYAAFALCAFATSAFASQKCDQETTQGTWAYTCEGTLPVPSQTATRLLGRCTASRSGFWDCEGSANLGGQILPQVLHGQATNFPNCTGKISYVQTIAGAPAGTLDINYVIHSKGDAISGLPTNSGGVLSCSLHRIGNTPD
jgi:hypothetical protein